MICLKQSAASRKPTDPVEKPQVLILCTGNSCRSHMAEGTLRQAAGDVLGIHSAGSNPAGYVHPLAIEVMREIGIDISGHTSKHLDQHLNAGIDVIITVCGHASDACPVFSGKARFTNLIISKKDLRHLSATKRR